MEISVKTVEDHVTKAFRHIRIDYSVRRQVYHKETKAVTIKP